MATNIILWIRTLIKESMEEIEEYETEVGFFAFSLKGSIIWNFWLCFQKAERLTENHDTQQCDILIKRLESMEKLKEECNEFQTKILPENILSITSPYFFPFVIEFSLIGASVFYIMSNHIGVM